MYLPNSFASTLYIPLFGLPIARKMAETHRRPTLSIRSFTLLFIGSLALLQLFILWTANVSNLGRILNVIWLFVITGYFFLLQLLLNKYLSGKARAYDQTLTDRARLVSACRTDTCYVPALSDVPATIFCTDIRPLSDKSGQWINYYYSQYRHSGFVVPDGPVPAPSTNLETLRDIGKLLRSHLAKK